MASKAQVEIVLKMIDKTSKQMDRVSSATKRMGTNMTKVGKTMTRNVSLPLLAIGAAGIKMAVDLDKSMRNIQAFGGQTEDQLKDLSQTFKDMSLNAENGTQSAQQLADAFFNIQSAGFLGAEGMEVLSVSAKAATAGLTTTQKASEGIMTVLNAYSLAAEDATRVSDILFTTIKLGVGTFEQLIPTLGDVVPLANAMGIQFEELAAAYVVMSKQGIEFNKAATQQKAIMTQLLSPGKALQTQMTALGFASGQAMVDALGFLGAIDALASSVGNTSTGVQALFVNTRAVSGVLALTGENAEKAAIALQEMQVAGAAQEAFNKQMQSFSAQFSIFKNTLGVFLIDVGEKLLPILMKLMETVRGLFAAWQNLGSGVQTVIIAVGAFLAIGGPLLIFFGAIIGAIGTIVGGFTALAGAFGLTAAASVPAAAGVGAVGFSLTALLAPLAAVVLPIAAVAAAFAGLIAFGPRIIDLGKKIVGGFVNFIKDPIGSVASVVGKVFGVNLKKTVVEEVKQTGQAVNEELAQMAMNAAKSAIGMGTTLSAGAQAGGQAAVSVLGQVADATVKTANFMVNTLSQAAGAPENLRGIPLGGTGSRTSFRSIMPQRKKFKGEDIFALAAARRAEANKRKDSPVSSLQQGLKQIRTGGEVSGDFGNFLRKFGLFEDSPQVAAAFNAFKAIGGALGPGGPTLPQTLAAATGGGGGDVNITIKKLIVPAGTPQEAVEFIWEELGQRLKKLGISGGGIIAR